jgi:hypothetical protein
MEPAENKQSGSSSGSIAAVAGIFAVIGAAVGAIGYHLLKKEPMQENPHTRCWNLSEVEC